MKLTRRTDYALRTLLYLAVHPEDEGLVSREEIADAYDISPHHIAKITADLADFGYVESRRGRAGGLRLGAEPESISIGQVVRRFEPHFEFADCMSDESECPLTPVCELRFLLDRALVDFLETLDDHTLADVVRREDEIRSALGVEAPPAE